MAPRARVLIAAPEVVIRQLGAAVMEHVDVAGAPTWERALECLSEPPLHLVVICYVFDELRPYRLIQHVRDSAQREVPIILVRAVSVPLGETRETDLRKGYSELGANLFLNFSDYADRHGLDAALQEFQRSVHAMLATQSGIPTEAADG